MPRESPTSLMFVVASLASTRKCIESGLSAKLLSVRRVRPCRKFQGLFLLQNDHPNFVIVDRRNKAGAKAKRKESCALLAQCSAGRRNFLDIAGQSWRKERKRLHRRFFLRRTRPRSSKPSLAHTTCNTTFRIRLPGSKAILEILKLRLH